MTDALQFDSVSHVESNPNQDWFFRTRRDFDLATTGVLLLMVEIGKVPHECTKGEVAEPVSAVLLPMKDMTPRQSRVSWTREAVEALQKAGTMATFDVGRFMNQVIEVRDFAADKTVIKYIERRL